jgi:D-glycero-alpha-D-manno-heptose-7-phosphate kinase
MYNRHIRVYSPLRVSFIGGGTDITPFPEEYGGAVLNTTIDIGVLVRYMPDAYPLEIVSRDLVSSYLVGTKGRSNLEKLSKMLSENGLRYGKILINGDVPPGSGLGSSSALVTALTLLGSSANGKKLDSGTLALKAYNTERNDLGVLLGFQDPYAIAIGGFKFMEFHGSAEYSIEKFRKSKSFIEYISSHMLLLYTGGTRESTAALKEQVSRFRSGDSKTIERLSGLKQLAFNARDCVRASDIDGFADVINSGWGIKRGLSRGVSNSRIDSLVNFGIRNGAMAGRLLGGGSDGFIMFIAKERSIGRLQKSLSRSNKFVVRASISEKGTHALDADTDL